MKVLITGGDGFIGSLLSESLQKEHLCYLTLVKEHTSLFPDNELIVEKFTLFTDWSDRLSGVDVVIHLAGCAHKNYTQQEYNKLDYQPSKNLIKQASSFGVKRFIYLSTVNVYEGGDLDVTVSLKSQLEAKKLSSKNKLAIENEIRKYCKESQMDYCIIRSPLVYGKGVRANFASLMNFVGKGFPLPFRGVKNNKRSLVSVYNLVDLIKECIVNQKAANQTFLVSDDHDLSTAEMVALMAKVQNKKNLALPIPVWCFKLAGKLFNKNDIIDSLTGSLQLDISHTKSTLGWAPPYSVEHGFKLAAKKSSTK